MTPHPAPRGTVLLTGATGYIGSHTWLALWQAGYQVLGIDSFVNSSPEVLARLAELGGQVPDFEQIDVRDQRALAQLIRLHRVVAVIHFAAHKSVSASTAQPLEYYENNLGGLLALCTVMAAGSAPGRLVFSSSATVYGDAAGRLPLGESAATSATNPYGQTKLFGEQIMADQARADPRWRHACLRYFNPVGAHPSGRMGEDPQGLPNNLMPYVAQVAVGRRPVLKVYGDDYATPDGTGVRDYIHVMDLAEGHVAAVRHLLGQGDSTTLNLGTGHGHSVLDVVRAYEQACGHAIAVEMAPRRAGDVAACWADPALAEQVLGWHATRDLAAMCADSWRWQRLNPEGYRLPEGIRPS